MYAPSMTYTVKLSTGAVLRDLPGDVPVVLRPLNVHARGRWDRLLAPGGLAWETIVTPGMDPFPGQNARQDQAVAQCLRGTWDGVSGAFKACNAVGEVIWDRNPNTPPPSPAWAGRRPVRADYMERPPASFDANVTTLADTFVSSDVLLRREYVAAGERWDVGVVVSDGSSLYLEPGDEAKRVYLAGTLPAALVRETATGAAYFDDGGGRVTLRVKTTAAGGAMWLVGDGGREVFTDPPQTLADLASTPAPGLLVEITPGAWAWVK